MTGAPSQSSPARPYPRALWRALGAFSLLWFTLAAFGQTPHIRPPSPGLIEAGVPPFSIRGHEGFGLRSPATDLKRMPDGRILVFAARQLAIGDGVRWELFQQLEGDPYVPSTQVAVDQDGEIYLGIDGGFARIQFLDSGRWRIVPVVELAMEDGVRQPVLRSVIIKGDEWYWHGDSGPLVRWRPGQKPVTVGHANTIEHVLRLGKERYYTDRTSGWMRQFEPAAQDSVPFAEVISVSDTVTASVALDQDSLLVGTYARGVQVFKQGRLQPFIFTGPLSRSVRVNDVAIVGEGFYAAAIENKGVYFFDRTGHIVQALERTLDHRLGHVRHILASAGGVIWALLDDGVLRVEFPARVTNFVPYIGTGASTAHPYRLDGRLWMMADGRILRAQYDETGRLIDLVGDNPADRFAYAFEIVAGVPIVGTERGTFIWVDGNWKSVRPEQVNFRPVVSQRLGDRFFYVSRGEMGWFRVQGDVVTFESFPLPDLADVYNTSTDSHGITWMEMGNGRLGRMHVINGRPNFRLFGAKEGVPQGWAQVFQIEGEVRFNVSDQVLRFDDLAEHFVADAAFHQTFPGMTRVIGRPMMDARGRAWITADGGIKVFARNEGGWKPIHLTLPAGLSPYFFCMQDDGVVWMHSDQKLMRFDPSMPETPPVALSAYISHIFLPNSNRLLFPKSSPQLVLAHGDNNIAVHYGAVGGEFADTVSFEVMLEGADSGWVSAGSVGSTVFNRLKEGRYRLHVRPRSEGRDGLAAVLEFRIQPPWYRTTAAYLAYIACAVGIIAGVAWLASYLQRRENSRLEDVVAQRTRELNETNFQLAHQVEEIRRLSQAIEQSPVGVALTRPDGSIIFANPRFCDLCGYSGTELLGRNLRTLRGAPFPSSLESQIESTVASGEAWHGELSNLTKDGRTVPVRTTISPIRSPDGLIRSHLILEEDISEWMAEQDRRKRLESQLLQAQKLDALGTLAGGIAHDFNNILTGILGYCELATLDASEPHRMANHLEEIRAAGLRAKDLIARILTFSRQSNTALLPLDLSATVAEALKFLRASIPATIEILPTLRSGNILGDSTQIHQVVANLCTNAMHAMRDRSGQIRVAVTSASVDAKLASEIPDLAPGAYMKLEVTDSGHGMEQATLDRIFDPFFTTKQTGDGTGLGLAIVRGIVASHHGALRVRSTIDVGTTFELYFPHCAETPQPKVDITSAPAGDGQEILVVDDEGTIANFVAHRLIRLGYRASIHTDPKTALAAFRDSPSHYHAVVTDLTMPGMTGLELLTQIRNIRQVPAIIMSGYGLELLNSQPDLLQKCTIMPKPFNGNDLNRALQEALIQVKH